MRSGRSIAAFQAENDRLQSIEPTTELGTCTLSVTMIQGGSGGNVIPASCWVVAGQRTVPGFDPHDTYERLAAIATEACPLPVTIESLLPAGPDGRFGSAAFYQPGDTPFVQSLARWAGTEPTVAPFGTNALRYSGLAREAVVFGPGAIDDAHGETECVAIADLVRLAEVYTRWLAPA